MSDTTFIIDCPWCKAKVAAIQKGIAENDGFHDEADEPYANRLYVGECPACHSLLAGESHQVRFADWKGDIEDVWSDVRRIYPQPARTFSSYRIPRVVTDSLLEADKSLQAGAYTASCVMFGRALEALCMDVLDPGCFAPTPPGKEPKAKKKIMLAKGLQKLKEEGHIDERLFDWSQQLRAFRNLAAHAEDIQISRQDAGDLQAFVFAIIEYIYDLTDRYEEFKARLAKQEDKSQ